MGKNYLFIYLENSDVVTFFFAAAAEALHFDELIKVQVMDVYTIACSSTWRNMIFSLASWITHTFFFLSPIQKVRHNQEFCIIKL
jgi:hypothetical protein